MKNWIGIFFLIYYNVILWFYLYFKLKKYIIIQKIIITNNEWFYNILKSNYIESINTIAKI